MRQLPPRRSAPNRSLLVAAMLASLGGAAAAQNVTIYGVVDIALQTRNRAPTADKSLTEIRSGNLTPSIWGFKGSEDLGNGLKAFFALEGHYSSDTGGLTSGPGFGSQIFRRQSNVGLSSDWGTLTLGGQYSPAIIGTIGVEPRAWKENMSSLFVWAYSQLSGPGDPFGEGANASNDVGVFINNAVQYSNTFGPVWLGVAYSLGEVAGSGKKGNQISLGGSYTGPVVVGFGYHKMHDSASGVPVNTAYDLGVAVPLGAFTVKLNGMQIKDKDPASGTQVSKVRNVGLGVDWKWSAANTANATYYHTKYDGDDNATTRSLTLSNDYAISKRTTLFAQYSYIDADRYTGSDPLTFLKSSILADGQLMGAKTSVLALGIRHTF